MLWFVISLMIVIALAFVIWPLLGSSKNQFENRREQNIQIAQDQLKKIEQDKLAGSLDPEEYKLAREEIEKTLHNDLLEKNKRSNHESSRSYIIGGGVGVVLPILVVALYTMLGSPSLVGINDAQITPVASKETIEPKSSTQVADVRTMFDKLKQRLESEPDDGQGWMMMGLTYMHFEQYDQAVDAYQKALELLPNDNAVIQGLNKAKAAQSGNYEPSNEAEVIEKKMVAPNGQTVDVGSMVMRLRNKLEANPNNLDGWLMLGRSYMTLGKSNDAVEAYQNALKLSPNDPNIKLLIEQAAGQK